MRIVRVERDDHLLDTLVTVSLTDEELRRMMPSEYSDSAFKRALFGPDLVPQHYAGQTNAAAASAKQADLADALDTMGEQLQATQAVLRDTRKALYTATMAAHDEAHHHRSFAFCQEKLCQAYMDLAIKIEDVT